VVYCAPRSHQYIPSPLDVECREAERLESRHEVVAYVRREITQHSPSNAAQSRRGRSTCEGEAAGLGHRSATKNNVPSANATYTSWIFLSSPVLPIGLTNARPDGPKHSPKHLRSRIIDQVWYMLDWEASPLRMGWRKFDYSGRRFGALQRVSATEQARKTPTLGII